VSNPIIHCRSIAPFSGLGERPLRCEEGVNGRDWVDGVSTGISLGSILKISAPPRYNRPNWGGPVGGSKIVRLHHIAQAPEGVKYWSVNGPSARILLWAILQ
jgi:hypothetical protein